MIFILIIFFHSFIFFLGNGYIEGRELDNFLREFVSSVNASDVGAEVCCLYFLH